MFIELKLKKFVTYNCHQVAKHFYFAFWENKPSKVNQEKTNQVKANRGSHEVEGLDFSLANCLRGELFNSASESTNQSNSLNLVIFLCKMYLFSLPQKHICRRR